MANYNLSRFSHVETLKSISPIHLLALLTPYAGYLNERGLILPSFSTVDELDCELLSNVLMSPDANTPDALLEALFYVDEMSTAHGMDALLQEAESNGITLDGSPSPTPADIAVQFYLLHKEILERKHAEQFLVKVRSFEYFQTDVSLIPQFKKPTEETLVALEKDLDDWFESKKRGRGSRVFVYPKPDAVWFLVRHGDPLKREGSLKGDQPSSVFYRPEKYDVLVYDQELGEIRMHACSKGEKDIFRRELGRHLFGNEDFFPDGHKYTLEPLRTSGAASLVCTDVEGLEWVRLKEIHFFLGGAEKEIEVRRANDLFAAYAGREHSMPQHARIIRANFLVKFKDSKTPRTVSIRPTNIAHYAHDNDAIPIEDWLRKRGFIISEREGDAE